MSYQKTILCSFFCFLSACSTPSGVWVKDNLPALEADQDKYVCLKDSQQPYGYVDGNFGGGGWGWGWGGMSNGYSGVRTNETLYAACMKAKGYQWQPDIK
jgi:hypothetical protein